MKLSFLIPTYNRCDALMKTIDKMLNAIAFSQENAEIVVIDNASTDKTYETVEALKSRTHVPIVLYKEARQGINNARNAALKHATGDIMVFIDDDCHVHETFVEKILTHYRADDEPVLRFGAVLLGDEADWPMTVKTYPQRQYWKITQPERGHLRSGDIIGCCMAMPRTIYERIGDFDPIFSTRDVPGGNDTEYGFRVYLAGYAVEYVPDVIVYHYHGRNTGESVRKLVRKYCIGGGAVYAKYLFKHPHILQKLSKKAIEIDQRAAPEPEDDPRSLMIEGFYKEYRWPCFFLGFLSYYKLLLKKKMGCDVK